MDSRLDCPVKVQVSDKFDLELTWDNTTPQSRTQDRSVLRFSPCSISEFSVNASIRFAACINYQGPLVVEFETCAYAFAMLRFAAFLREFAAEQRVGTVALEQDLVFAVVEDASCPVPIAQLRYEHMRCHPMHVMSELHLHLGPIEDPLGAARAIEEVIQTLQMDCDWNPEHGPVALPKKRP